MSVKKEPSGRRSIQVEVEVPGSPEEVWQAIATAEGVSSWFVPVDVETDESGKPVRIISHFGPGMDGVATPTGWDPPRRLAAESRDFGPDAPTFATEWIVESHAGGTCTVRVVHSLFASTDDWDNQLENIESGWPSWFRILRLYLMYFRGQPCSAFRLMGSTTGGAAEGWDGFIEKLGFSSAVRGERCQSGDGVPRLDGVVEEIRGESMASILLKTEKPAPGIAFAYLIPCGAAGPVLVGMSVYLYGEQAASVAAREEPAWQAWMGQHFPMGEVAGHAG